jgi:hypothetical protein
MALRFGRAQGKTKFRNVLVSRNKAIIRGSDDDRYRDDNDEREPAQARPPAARGDRILLVIEDDGSAGSFRRNWISSSARWRDDCSAGFVSQYAIGRAIGRSLALGCR